MLCADVELLASSPVVGSLVANVAFVCAALGRNLNAEVGIVSDLPHTVKVRDFCAAPATAPTHREGQEEEERGRGAKGLCDEVHDVIRVDAGAGSIPCLFRQVLRPLRDRGMSARVRRSRRSMGRSCSGDPRLQPQLSPPTEL